MSTLPSAAHARDRAERAARPRTRAEESLAAAAQLRGRLAQRGSVARRSARPRRGSAARCSAHELASTVSGSREVERADRRGHWRPSAERIAGGRPRWRVASPGPPDGEAAVERGERHARTRSREVARRGARAASGRRRRSTRLAASSSRPRPRRGAARRPRASYAPAAPSVASSSKRAARAEAGQREALEHAREAPLRRPAGLAGERRGLRARALRPGAVGRRRCGCAPGQVGQLAARPARARGERSPPAARRAGSGEREQERQPGRLLEVGLRGDRRVRAGRLEPRGGGGERGGEALGVGGRAQAGHERVAVAVVGGAREPARDDAAGGRAARRRAARPLRDGVARPRRAGAFAAARPPARGEQIGQFAVRRLWRQKSGIARLKTLAARRSRVPPRGASA